MPRYFAKTVMVKLLVMAHKGIAPQHLMKGTIKKALKNAKY